VDFHLQFCCNLEEDSRSTKIRLAQGPNGRHDVSKYINSSQLTFKGYGTMWQGQSCLFRDIH